VCHAYGTSAKLGTKVEATIGAIHRLHFALLQVFCGASKSASADSLQSS